MFFFGGVFLGMMYSLVQLLCKMKLSLSRLSFQLIGSCHFCTAKFWPALVQTVVQTCIIYIEIYSLSVCLSSQVCLSLSLAALIVFACLSVRLIEFAYTILFAAFFVIFLANGVGHALRVQFFFFIAIPRTDMKQ